MTIKVVMSIRISSESGNVIRNIIIKVNENQEFRERFFRDPIAVMESEGLVFNEEAKDEIRLLHEALMENLEELSRLPSGYDPLIEGLKEKIRPEKLDFYPPFIH